MAQRAAARQPWRSMLLQRCRSREAQLSSLMPSMLLMCLMPRWADSPSKFQTRVGNLNIALGLSCQLWACASGGVLKHSRKLCMRVAMIWSMSSVRMTADASIALSLSQGSDYMRYDAEKKIPKAWQSAGWKRTSGMPAGG